MNTFATTTTSIDKASCLSFTTKKTVWPFIAIQLARVVNKRSGRSWYFKCSHNSSAKSVCWSNLIKDNERMSGWIDSRSRRALVWVRASDDPGTTLASNNACCRTSCSDPFSALYSCWCWCQLEVWLVLVIDNQRLPSAWLSSQFNGMDDRTNELLEWTRK